MNHHGDIPWNIKTIYKHSIGHIYITTIIPILGISPIISKPFVFTVLAPGSDALVSGSRFDWTVADPWRELCKFPKASSCVAPLPVGFNGMMEM